MKRVYYHSGAAALRMHFLAAHDEAAGKVDLANEAGKVIVRGVPLVEGVPAPGQASFDPRPVAAVDPDPVVSSSSSESVPPPVGDPGKIDFKAAGFASGVDFFAAGLEGGQSFTVATLEANLTHAELLQLAGKFAIEGVKASMNKGEIAAAILGDEDESESSSD